MRSARCGFENPDRMQRFPPRPPVSTSATLLAQAPTPGRYTPRHLVANLLTFRSALAGQRAQVVESGVTEARG